jgi:type II secretory pathway pseudopilin PulG
MQRTRTPGRPRGFSVVEILVVLGIVIAVISTVVVGLNLAASRARVANTEFLMSSISNALSRFRSETGYLPVALGDPSIPGIGTGTPRGPVTGAPTPGWGRDGLKPPSLAQVNGAPNYGAWNPAERQGLQLTGSVTSLPEFLLGPGDRSQDGYGVIMVGGALPTATDTPGYREQPALGIRNPGSDGLWGAWTNWRSGTTGGGLFAARNLATPSAVGNDPTSAAEKRNPLLKGKSLGPYLEVKSDAEIGALIGFAADGTPQVAKAGEVNDFDAYPKVFLDYFGKPIMYYRRGYLNDDPRTIDRSWSLADIVALRPARFAPGDDVPAMPDQAGDNGASRAALGAEFGLLSFGPDQRWNPQVRADPAGFNEDNIVRFGP